MTLAFEVTICAALLAWETCAWRGQLTINVGVAIWKLPAVRWVGISMVMPIIAIIIQFTMEIRIHIMASVVKSCAIYVRTRGVCVKILVASAKILEASEMMAEAFETIHEACGKTREDYEMTLDFRGTILEAFATIHVECAMINVA